MLHLLRDPGRGNLSGSECFCGYAYLLSALNSKQYPVHVFLWPPVPFHPGQIQIMYNFLFLHAFRHTDR